MHSLNIPETSNPIAVKISNSAVKIRGRIAAKPRAHAMKTRTRTHIAPPPQVRGFGD